MTIKELILKLKPEQLKPILAKTALDISKNITSKIEANVPLKVLSRIQVTDDSVILSGAKIPIEDFNPNLTKFSVSRGSVKVDMSMWTKERSLKKGFWNPKISRIMKRKGAKAYPVLPQVYGPSIAQLYQQKHRTLTAENQNILLNNLQDNLGI
jgi:hypothetical protein